MTLKEQVKKILEENPVTRNSDITLMTFLWKEFYSGKISGWDPQDGIEDGEGSVRLVDLYDLPREDAIKRIRAQFNHEGLFWPTDLKVALGRKIQEDQWKEKLGYPKVEDTKHPTKDQSYTEFINSEVEKKNPELL